MNLKNLLENFHQIPDKKQIIEKLDLNYQKIVGGAFLSIFQYQEDGVKLFKFFYHKDKYSCYSATLDGYLYCIG